MKEQDFRQLYLGRAPALRRTAFLLCGDWQLAEDLVQVAFEKVYASWSRLREPEAVLRRTLVRCWVDETRRPHRREHVVEELPESGLLAPEREDRAALGAALSTVPPRQRACLVLRFYDDLSVAETARLLGCTEGTVKSQTSRGLDALRAALGAPATREALL